MKIPFSPPDISDLEIQEVISTLQSGWITTGPRTKELERKIAEYCGADRAVCLNSATACMELTLRILGVGQGDEVIVPSYTYTATASVVYHVGATIVMVDCAKDSYEMDYEQLEKAITERTKLIIPVDLAGIICDYHKIYEIIERKQHLFHASNKIQKAYGRIIIMADAAHAIGAYMLDSVGNKVMCGTIADFTSFSFHAVKNLTTAEGGAVTWKNHDGVDSDWLYKEYMLLSLHGQSKDALAKTEIGAWEYDIVAPYYKCNMTDIMAAIGLKQLERYDILCKKRKEIVQRYNDFFFKWNDVNNVRISYMNHLGEDKVSSCHLYLTRISGITEQERNRIIHCMAEKGIATNVHYKPLPLLTAYKNLGYSIKDYPNAYNQYCNEITLPLHTKLTTDMVDYIAESYLAIIKENLQ